MPTQTGNTPPPSPGLQGKQDEFAPDDDGGENMDINRQTLELYTTTDAVMQATQAAWKMFMDRHHSKEAAGEAIYQALYEAAPSLQSLFSTSKSVQAPKFMIALHELIMAMRSPEALQTFVETLGFQHLHLETTSARVVIFRDAILDVIAFELGDQFTEEAKNGLHSLMNYAGGGIIYVRTHYADRLRILRESWKVCKDKAKSGSVVERSSNDETSENSSEDGEEREKSMSMINNNKPEGTIGKMKSFFRGNSKSDGNGHGDHEEHHSNRRNNHNNNNNNRAMPTSFEEMFAVNSAVMGIAVGSWMTEVLESFDSLVSNVANSARMKEETDVLALKLSKHDGSENLDLDTFKACMLAALRSLLPKSWTSAHEVAWTWMWENVARLLTQVLGNIPKYQKALEEFLEGMDEASMFDMRKATYERLFEMAPATQFYFKQSNTRLHFISERIMNMSVELFQEPKHMLADISAVGLRHVEFGIPTDLFAPFVSSSVEVMCTVSQDSYALDAYRWSLGLISRILVRTINEGSTLVMQAINANSMKSLKKAIDSAPRAERAAWLLDIQVGTQSISPLSWAIESGALEVAKLIIKDLLTIRSDRDTYYFGALLLFTRHPDIVRRLVEDAPVLLPTMLDGLVWRSHRHEKGMRRVNYYVKYLLINPAGEFADALKWLAATGDPATIAHPVVSVLSDSLWSGVVYRQFVVNKMWNVLSLLVFMLSQGILPGYITRDSSDSERDGINWAIAMGRVFSYTLNMSRLACFHLARIWGWCRQTMKRIFDEIDEDGSGSIDWEEFMAAIGLFKQSLKDQFFEVFKFLKDDEGPAMMEDSRQGISKQSNGMYNIISFVLMVLLATMLTHEPMLWCMGSDEWPTAQCPEMNIVKYRYSIFSCSALVIHWLILVDLAVFSTEISAFLLVCSHVMGEVKTFLCALTFLLVTFGSSIPIFCTVECPVVAGNYSSMPRAVVSLFAITLGWFEADSVMDVKSEDRMFLAVLFIFVGLSVILLLNLLIAQLNRSYEYIYQDMLGFARLNRASLIVEAMNACSKSKWRRFLVGMHMDQKIEFDVGDLGIAGGMQAKELRGEHSVLEDNILRFGGSTSPEQPWPTHMDAGAEDQDDRFDRLEQLLMKAVKRCSAAKRASQAGHRRGSGSGTAGGTGTGGSSGFSDETALDASRQSS